MLARSGTFFIPVLKMIGFNFLALSMVIGLAHQAVASSPTSLTYQGRILKSDGTPLDYSNVSFIFQITNPNGSCILYQEQVTGYSFVNSGGVFDVPIGEGTIQYPLGGAASILDEFDNSKTFNCGNCSLVNGVYSCVNGSNTYTASVGDVRKLRVSFYDGNGWKTIAPDNIIRSVPYAGYASSAQKLGSNIASDFLLKAGLPTCANGTFLSYNGAALTCESVAGASGGTVTSVSGTSPISVATGTTTPVISISQASSTTNGYLSSTDWNIFNSKLGTSLADSSIWVGQAGTPTAVTPSGDVSMTNAGAFSVIGLRGQSISSTTASGAGQVLRYDGTKYGPAFVGLSDIRAGVTPFAGTFTSAGCTSDQSLYWQSSTDTFQCQSISINDSQLAYSTSRNANTFLAAPNGAAGTPTFRTIASADLPAGTLSGSGTTGYIPYYSTGNTLADSPFFTNSGKVGLGTNSPSSLLHLEDGSVYNWSNGSSPASALVKFGIDSSGNGLLVKAPSGRSGGTYLGIYNQFGTNVFTVSESGTTIGGTDRTSIVKGTTTGTYYNTTFVPDIDIFGSTDSTKPAAVIVDARTAPLTERAIPLLRFAYDTQPQLTNSLGGINALNDGANRGLSFYSYKSASGSFVENFRILDSGNMGIGTTTPDFPLEITRTAPGTISSAGTTVTGTGTTFLSTFSVGDSIYCYGQVRTIVTVDSDTSLTVNAAFNPVPTGLAYTRTVAKHIGTVEIEGNGPSANGGISGPLDLLVLKNTYSPHGWSVGSAIKFEGENGIFAGRIGTSWNGGLNYADMFIQTSNANPAVWIGYTGNVAIGTTAANAKFTTLATGARASNYTAVSFSNTTTSATASINKVGLNIQSTGAWNGAGAVNTGLVVNATGATTNYAATFDGGNVGISNSTPETLLHVGSSLVTAGTAVAQFETATGICTLTPATAGSGIACSSDERLKENIQEVSGDLALNKILQLQAVNYNFKKDSSKDKKTGYIAQEVKKVAPEFVRQNKNGFYQIYYDGFIPWITEAIKELHVKFEVYTSQNERKHLELKQKIQNLERKTFLLESENLEMRKQNKILQQRLDHLEKIINK